MSADYMLQLETAAKIMLAPPSLITPEQRLAAEQVFLTYRLTKSPYILCKEVLQTSTVDYVLFETASTLKEAVVRERKDLQESEIIELRQYLYNYVVEKPNLPPFVRERILQVIAIIIKLQSVRSSDSELSKVLTDVNRLIMEGDLPRKVLGCCMLLAIVQEYSNNDKSSEIGLIWVDHLNVKTEFEALTLKKILQIGVTALMEVVQFPVPFHDGALTLLKSLLSVCETVLNWKFSNVTYSLTNIRRPSQTRFRRMVTMFETPSEDGLRLGSDWEDFILDPKITNLFFEVYWKIRDTPHLAHHAMSCLTRLASLSGAVVDSREHRISYFTNYLESFIKLVTSIEILDREALGFSNIINNLITYCFLLSSYSSIFFSQELVRNFLEQFTSLTIRFTEGSAYEESVQADDCLYTEAFDNLIIVWLTVLRNSQDFPDDLPRQSFVQLFNSYLRCHLAPPDGIRGSGQGTESDNIDEGEEIDRLKFKSQLQAIGALSREVPRHTIPLLVELLEIRTNNLRSRLENIHQQGTANSNLVELFEDIHWLLLISGHVIAMESEGETPLIPSEIMDFSIQQAANVDASVRVLASSINSEPANADQLTSTDSIIRMVASVFRLCDIEKKVAEANLPHLFSPLVSETLVWFLSHWSLSYLLHHAYYTEVSQTITSSFGSNSDGALWSVSFILNNVESNLKMFQSEPAIIDGTIVLINSLVNVREKASFVVKNERYWRLIELYGNYKSCVSPAARRGLMKAFTLGGCGIDDEAERKQYWLRVLKPLTDKLQGVVRGERFKTTYQEEAVRSEVIDVLESFIGVAQGTHITTVSDVFPFTAQVLRECPELIALYCNYQLIVELILELYVACAREFLCLPLSSESRNEFCQCCLNIAQMYAKSNRGKRSIEASAEEDAYDDILLLMQLFSCLQSKLINDSDSAGISDARAVDPADVCLYGLRILLPLITIDLLKFPSLCHQYYKMISAVCCNAPAKFCSMDADLLNSVFYTIQLGLHSFGNETNELSCSFLEALGVYVYNSGHQSRLPNFSSFVQFLLDLVLCRQVDSEALCSCGSALYVLICCYQAEYKSAADRWISLQTDAVTAGKLAKAFALLTSKVDLNTRHRATFRISFEEFVAEVHGFLLVK